MRKVTYLIIFACLVIFEQNAFAYIGPGAGFAVLGSGFVFVLTILMAIATIALWPLQWLWRRLSGKHMSKHARARRVIILGLDGLEPKLVDKYAAEGLLPNMKRLSEEGSYERLGTTLPALSPVAWSTFQTGVNPGAHNIFDFLTRDKRFCMPLLSSTTTESGARIIKIGPLKFKFGTRAEIKLLRKSQPFWKILGKHGIFSNVLRVPISYPPEKFNGNILSAMCTPDLRGTQGSFTFYTTDSEALAQTTGGEALKIERRNNLVETWISGPQNPNSPEKEALKLKFSLVFADDNQRALLEIGDQRHTLEINKFSDWIPLNFKYGMRGNIRGIARFCLRSVYPHVSLYVSPINADPDQPVLPIAQPIIFANWLAKRMGSFGTLGLMEDTWGRNEHALDDRRFLDQSYLNHDERERMFLDTLDRTREGLCACVFDASDRIQHMFWRYLDSGHPSPRETGADSAEAIPKMYQKMDALVGKVLGKLRETDVLLVISDHGFASFRRCLSVNTWLMQNGYLVLKDGGDPGADYLRDVDWSKTKAFGIGLSGIFLNRKGRERNGTVEAKDVAALKLEISAKLESLSDPSTGTRAIRKVYDTAREYRGVYAAEAPDLILGYEPGYRVSWDSITGCIEKELFSDNIKAWSGDHHVDPALIPGIFLCNRKLKVKNPHIVDIAPTTLSLFAVPIPQYMEGKVII